jgi:hypothetical protein
MTASMGHGISAVEIDWAPSIYHVVPQASMGPRHFCRGNMAVNLVANHGQPVLQWGHGISAVEMVLTDIAVLLHVLAHNASASVDAPQWIHVVQPT